LIYDLLQAEKHDELLTKKIINCAPSGHHLCLKFTTIVRTLKRSLVARNSKRISRESGTKISIISKKNKDSHKGKGTFKKNFRHDNSQVCQRCGCHNHITKKCHTAKHLVELYQKSVGKQVHGDKYEAHFTTEPTDASCSKDTPLETIDEKTPPQTDDLFSTEDMLVEFQSNDIFGDTN